MEIVTQEKTKELKPYPFNEEMFGLLKGSDYEALKKDIKKNGVKVELHILPDKTVICGHQRLKIARELKIEHLRCKTVTDLDTEDKIKEYVILDNLLRRHLSKEKRAFLHYELYKMKFKGSGGDHKSEGKQKSHNDTFDIYTEVAQQTNVSRATVARDVEYVEAVKENPELLNKKQSVVLREKKKKKDKERIESEVKEKKLDGKYKTIVIDPPWKHYGNEWGYQAREQASYNTMTDDEIISFLQEKVLPHIDDNAHIYFWVINNRIHDGLHILEKLGFDYKTIITWCKPQMGMGKYFRNNTEQILFCVKGSLDLKENDLPTWFKADRGKHSEKPDESYELIEKASYPPYLDVFSRKKRKNWISMGNIDE